MEAGHYFENVKVGDKFVTGRRTITEPVMSTLINVAGYTAAIFQDEEFAKTTPLGWMAAPGEVTVLLMGALEEQMRMWAKGSVLVGFKDIKFLAPLKAGDTIRVEMEVTFKRETKNPKWGLVIYKEYCRNQKDELLAETEKVELITRRPAR